MTSILKSFFKRRGKPRCRHHKGAGEPGLDNMIEIARFSPYAKDALGYGVSECSVCGKRAFSCIGLHLMSPRVTGVIDSFIQRDIGLNEFRLFLEKEMAWHKLEVELKR